MSNNILQYESKIWATADLLRGSGIRESEWPSFMMPFFALAMIESRLIRMYADLKEEVGEKAFADITKDDLYALIIDKKQGYNIYLFEHSKTLKDICMNDKSFEIDFDAYLKGFDDETKDLLGVDPGEGEKFLNIKGVITTLKAEKGNTANHLIKNVTEIESLRHGTLRVLPKIDRISTLGHSLRKQGRVKCPSANRRNSS